MKKLYIVPVIITFLLMFFISCGDWINSVEPLINQVEDERLTDEENVEFLIKGVKGRWAGIYDDMTVSLSLMSDESFFDYNVPRSSWPAYNIYSGNALMLTSQSNGDWNSTCEVRFLADDLVRRVGEIEFTDQALKKEALFWGYFIGGITRLWMAYWWGLNEEEGGGVIDNGPFIPSAQMYELAMEKFNPALQNAPDAYWTRVVQSVIARLYLCKGDYAAARTAAAAGLVEGDEPFKAEYSEVSNNQWWSDSRGRSQFAMSFRYYDYIVEDPKEGTVTDIDFNYIEGEGTRLKVWELPGINYDETGIIYYLQDWCPTDASPIDFITWQEMELTVAECDLRDGNTASALTRINKVRAHHVLSPKTADDLNTDVLGILGMNLLAEERDKELVMQGMRIIDQRRFDLWHLPGIWQYMPIPENERERNENIPMRIS